MTEEATVPRTREKNSERRVVVSTFLTLDGVLQAPGAADEDRSSGFEHGGWQMPYVDDAAGAEITRGMDASDALLLGRRTYDIFAAFWPHQPEDDPMAARINGFDIRSDSRKGNGRALPRHRSHCDRQTVEAHR